jgi:hypothetical protein
MQAIGTLAAGARAAVSGALETLGHIAHGDTGEAVAVPAVPETGYVGARVIAEAAGKSVEEYLERRTTKVCAALRFFVCGCVWLREKSASRFWRVRVRCVVWACVGAAACEGARARGHAARDMERCVLRLPLTLLRAHAFLPVVACRRDARASALFFHIRSRSSVRSSKTAPWPMSTTSSTSTAPRECSCTQRHAPQSMRARPLSVMTSLFCDALARARPCVCFCVC